VIEAFSFKAMAGKSSIQFPQSNFVTFAFHDEFLYLSHQLNIRINHNRISSLI
jgi:hypothetical protein